MVCLGEHSFGDGGSAMMCLSWRVTHDLVTAALVDTPLEMKPPLAVSWQSQQDCLVVQW